MKQILIADDSADNLYLLNALLSGHGYVVIEARNGAEALERARADVPDLIISDILMPEMDGFTLCRLLKKDQRLKEIPFIFYTATYTDPRDEKLALDMGASAFMVKPMEPELFMRRVEETLAAVKAVGPLARQDRAVDADVILRGYNEALIRKLEQKMLELEQVNKAHQTAESDLRASEQRYRSLFENILDAVLLTIPDGRILKANCAACRMFGLEGEEMLRANRSDLMDTSDPRLAEALEERARTGKFHGELAGKRKDKSTFPCELTSVIFYEPDGNPRTSMIIRDITERKRFENDILKLNCDLEQKISERTAELSATIAQLEEINRVFVGRELKMAELKAQIEELKKEKA